MAEEYINSYDLASDCGAELECKLKQVGGSLSSLYSSLPVAEIYPMVANSCCSHEVNIARPRMNLEARSSESKMLACCMMQDKLLNEVNCKLSRLVKH